MRRERGKSSDWIVKVRRLNMHPTSRGQSDPWEVCNSFGKANMRAQSPSLHWKSGSIDFGIGFWSAVYSGCSGMSMYTTACSSSNTTQPYSL